MTFMHFDAHTAAAGVISPMLSGTELSPNTAFGVDNTDGVIAGDCEAGWIFSTQNVSLGAPTYYVTEQGSITRYDLDFGAPAYSLFNPTEEWFGNKTYTATYWIEANQSSLATPGDPPNAGNALDTPLRLAPGDPDRFWYWGASSKGSLTYRGTVRVQIFSDNGGAPGSVIATGYYRGSAIVTYRGSSGGGSCFTGNMLVLMANGTEKPIKDVIAGDMVKSYNERTGRIENVQVNGTMVPRVDKVYRVELSNGRVIETTQGHPFRTTDNTWVNINPVRAKIVEPETTVDCAKMEKGMTLQGASGSAEIVNITDAVGVETVYHLYDVGPYNNFFVEGTCVHNVTTQKK